MYPNSTREDINKEINNSEVVSYMIDFIVSGKTDGFSALKDLLADDDDITKDKKMYTKGSAGKGKDETAPEADDNMQNRLEKVLELISAFYNQKITEKESLYEKKIDGQKRYIKEMEETSRIMSRQNLVLSYFYQAGQLLSSSFDYDNIIASIVEMIGTIFSDSFCCLLTRNKEDFLKVHSDSLSSDQEFAAYFNENITMKIGESCEGCSVEDQVPQYIFDVYTDSQYTEFLPLAEKFDFRSVLSVPLIIRGKAEGCIVIYSREKRHFHDDEVRILTMFSDQAARALENAQLYQQTDVKLKSRIRELSLRRDIDKAIINNEKIAKIVDIIIYGLEQVFKGYGFAVDLTRFEADVTRWNENFRKTGIDIKIISELTTEVVQNKSHMEKPYKTDSESFLLLGFPIKLQDDVLGAFWVVGGIDQRIDLNLTEFIQWILEQLSIAIDKTKTLEQLIQAEKLRVMGSLLSGIAHELNNPLNRILNVSEMARDSEGLREFKRYNDIIHMEALRCKHIMEGFLAFSRKYKADEALVDINEIIRGALQLWRFQKKSEDIKIITNLQKDLPPVRINANRMQQVFLNMMVNACDALTASSSFPKILRINSTIVDNKIRLTFIDNGPGIPAENIVKVFQPFFTTKEVGKGTGLGLSISRDIVRENSGTIDVENLKDGGAQFTVELPAVMEIAQESRDTQEIKVSTAGARILIADDDVLILKLMSAFLKKEGYKVDTTTEGRACLKKIDENPYDVIITDMVMADIRGDKLLEQLAETNPKILKKTVLCTGDVLEQDKSREYENLGIQILYKPFELMELKEIVESVLHPE
jgi:signal transduction histidine kinase